MARSYPPRRFPAGPYLEPTVTPAMRGRKRTGPIGAIVPGDDIEVARELAREGKRPKREPVVVHVKLTLGGEDAPALEAGDGQFEFLISADQALMELIDVELYCETASTSGDVVVQLRKRPAQTFDADGLLEAQEDDVDLFVTDEALEDFRVRIEEGLRYSKHSEIQYEIDLAHSQMQAGDLLYLDVDEAGTGVKGVGIVYTFK